MAKHVKKYYLDWIENRVARKDEIDNHLLECNECRRYFEKMTELLDRSTFTNITKLQPDPYLPTRIAALASGENEVKYKPLVSKLQLSLEGFALVLALAFGIIFGKAFSHQPQKQTAVEIVTKEDNINSSDDFAAQFEVILQPLEGVQQ